MLPVDFVDCTSTGLAGDGDIAAATCGSALTQPGPQQADFYGYPDAATMDGVFQTDVATLGLAELPSGQDCTTSLGYFPWSTDDQSQTGMVGCAINTDGSVAIVWTDDQYTIEGVVYAVGSTQADVAALYTWWQDNSNYN